VIRLNSTPSGQRMWDMPIPCRTSAPMDNFLVDERAVAKNREFVVASDFSHWFSAVLSMVSK